MKRITFITSLILATLASTARVAHAQYTAYYLGTLGGSTSTPLGINSAGTVVGYSFISGDTAPHAFSYSGGVMTDLSQYLFGIGFTGNS